MIKNIKLPAALLSGVVIGAVAFTAVGVSAHNNGTVLTEEDREAKKVEMTERKDAALQEKVTEGIITEEQSAQIKSWIEEKKSEHEADVTEKLSKEDFQALSEEERASLKEDKQKARETRKAEAEAFFESIGVDKDDLFDGKQKGFGRKGHHANNYLKDKTGTAQVSIQ